MKNKKMLLYSIMILLSAGIYVTVKALQKNSANAASFAGEWKSKESISMGGNIVCCFNPGDRMLATTMKIDQQANMLTIATSSAFSNEPPVAGKEQFSLDGKKGEINYGPDRGKNFTVTLSADGQTMTINSVVHLMTAAPYKVNEQSQLIVYITEVWKLSRDGKSIVVEANAKSNRFDKGRFWKTVFNKIS